MRTTCTLTSCDSNRVKALPLFCALERRTVAGEPVPRNGVPLLSTATDQTNSEGVGRMLVKPGPARGWPLLPMATPWGVPFSKSSTRDWVQRCVPWATSGRDAKNTASAARGGARKGGGGRGVRATTPVLLL